MYQIEFNQQDRILTARVKGSWKVADVERYREEITATLRRLRLSYPTLSILADSREMDLPTKDVAAAFAEITSSDLIGSSGKVAILVAKMLNKLQADRMADGPLQKVFFDESEARAWLSTTSAS